MPRKGLELSRLYDPAVIARWRRMLELRMAGKMAVEMAEILGVHVGTVYKDLANDDFLAYLKKAQEAALEYEALAVAKRSVEPVLAKSPEGPKRSAALDQIPGGA